MACSAALSFGLPSASSRHVHKPTNERSLIILDESRKCNDRMPDVELLATNNPHAFISHEAGSTQNPPRRVTTRCGNRTFYQLWISQLQDLVMIFLRSLPWTWDLDILRCGRLAGTRDREEGAGEISAAGTSSHRTQNQQDLYHWKK
ncbi:hypothetical protein ONS95_001285 [Cadophora gregata]|uniref:uncharacterized protein n=1 Tax=Cadophora gregata TaxID=51156 RepID=UPI0026DAB6A3|nr:uncharacterized protein ONS95_001285 [Cadophora gregata]KAK0101903.1 hypothetical protein ONS96_005877 [Cadophora gregata f. sp. sojae]KAK0129358.1 hypothetical protein ONS95_001285 [Cadophora gregata]